MRVEDIPYSEVALNSEDFLKFTPHYIYEAPLGAGRGRRKKDELTFEICFDKEGRWRSWGAEVLYIILPKGPLRRR